MSLYYARALKAMGWQQSPEGDTDVTKMSPYSDVPNSYFFQAAMHWWPKYPNALPPAPYNERWNHCTHGPASTEQYFLAWHRGYIYFYELLVRAHVVELGGPDTWALPYWNYSYYDATDPSDPWTRSNLPWCFSQPTLPDGSASPLYIADTQKRGLQPTWPGTNDAMFLETATPYYDAAYRRSDFLGFNGTLDGRPHGAVHVDVGTGDLQVTNGGWMTSTVTASFDPIFWLHHSEIDRFWVGWNAAGNSNPSDQTWLNAQDDPLRGTRWNFWADGDLNNKIVVYPGQMLDPANLGDPFPYCYQYANLPTVPAPRIRGRRAVADALPALTARPTAVHGAPAIGAVAAAGDLDLGRESSSVSVPVSAEASTLLAAVSDASADEAPRVILRLENITADGPPGNYEIYLNYPDADRMTRGTVPHYVGLLAGFGADHHHGEGAVGHEGHHGLSASYDITDTVAYLRAHGGWDEREATVTFVPAARPREGFELQVSTLHVGSIRIETV